TESSSIATRWFEAKLNATMLEVKDLFDKFRISEALMAIYRLFWDEFSSWYLEMVKPAYGQPIDRTTYNATLHYFDVLLRLLHPFMPFITEELWQHLQERTPGQSIMYALLPDVKEYDKAAVEAMEHAKEVVIGVRGVRAAKNISPREALVLNVIGDWKSAETPVIMKLANLSEINSNAEKDAAAATFMVGTMEFNVPLSANIDVAAELEKLNKELTYYQGFLASVMKKLGNERFVNNAPAAVVEAERRKQADAETKIKNLEESIAALSK
uniref:class I tRNA ligase family protein n=1 Tax=uncultured Muribaculum sp. TaxID=1918613 RepID=UPI0025B50827